jgi:hypothetical protein
MNGPRYRISHWAPEKSGTALSSRLLPLPVPGSLLSVAVLFRGKTTVEKKKKSLAKKKRRKKSE